MVALQTGGLVSALQGLDVKPELIEDIVKLLTDTGSELPEGFENAQLAPQEFGHRSSAATLGTHYTKAFDVMQATIDGIAEDLVNFGLTAKAAVALVDDADATSAADLARAQAAVEDLRDAASYSQGDANYDKARNGHYSGSEGDR